MCFPYLVIYQEELGGSMKHSSEVDGVAQSDGENQPITDQQSLQPPTQPTVADTEKGMLNVNVLERVNKCMLATSDNQSV